MEIRYLRREENVRSRALYEEIFVEDEKAFVDAYYQIKAADNQILVAENEGEIISMLHRNPYSFFLRGEKVEADYIVAVATRLSWRHQGWMRRLLTRALQDMEAQKRPFTFLMPADEAIYTPFDFHLMGNDDEEHLAEWGPEKLAEEYDLYVQKDETYVRRHIDWPEWEETPMMIRPVHLPSLVAHIGADRDQELVIAVSDPILPENDGIFRWNFTQEGSTLTPTTDQPELHISIGELGSFLCGMTGAEELGSSFYGTTRPEEPGNSFCGTTRPEEPGSSFCGTTRPEEPGNSFCGTTRPEELAEEFREEVREKLRAIRVLEGIYLNETV